MSAQLEDQGTPLSEGGEAVLPSQQYTQTHQVYGETGSRSPMLFGEGEGESSVGYKQKAKDLGRGFLSLLTFLAILALIGSGLYVSIVAFPAIAAALATALALTAIPQAIITLIAVLPIIVMSLVALRFLQIHLARSRAGSGAPRTSIVEHYGLNDDSLRGTLTWIRYNPWEYLKELFARAIWIDIDRESKGYVGLEYFNRAAFATALGLGAYLTVKIAPALLAAVTALGVPFPVAVLFGAVAAATLIVITYQLLALVLTLNNLYHRSPPLASLIRSPYASLYVAGKVIGIGAAAALATVFYPLLVDALLPLVGSSSMAAFTAVAVSVAFTLLMMQLVPLVIATLPLYIRNAWRAKGEKGSSSFLSLSPERDQPLGSVQFVPRAAKEKDEEATKGGYFDRWFSKGRNRNGAEPATAAEQSEPAASYEV